MKQYICRIEWEVVVSAKDKEQALIEAYEIYNNEDSKGNIMTVEEDIDA